MVRKCRAVKIAEHGYLTDESGETSLCPVRGANCTLKCALLSLEGRILQCKNTIIGAIRGKPVQSFRLHTGPEVHNVDESLTEYVLSD